jgi:ATP-binding cassette subfamily B (MDR/TAP) protein 1
LNDVTIPIPENKVIAFVGASGCGKSSVMKLLERFYDPQSGELLYSDINVKDLDNKWLHQDQLAIVQQEPALFSTTIRANILYGTERAFEGFTQEQIQERFELACKQANVVSFLNDKALFPDGD